MNKTFQINLGGIPFTIDNDAYNRLDGYLRDLKRYFAGSESKEEIISDIEARLAELLRDRLKGREIVGLEDVDSTIAIMGTPTDFDAEPQEETKKRTSRPWDLRTGKRLFRHPDDKVFGGVCGGLAAYFGIEDPIWIRIAFALVFFTMGFGLLLYILMWIIVPEARTTGDRLAMMGEPANARNIADMIERGIDDLSETIKDNWKDFKSKKKSDNNVHSHRTYEKQQGWTDLLLFPLYLIQKVIITLTSAIRRAIRYQRARRYEKHPYV
jgi:phage shock protein PspC (stress-responsive transcriptional regulator)